MPFQRQLLHALLQPSLQQIRPSARFPRVEAGVNFTGLLLKFEILGAVVPVGDLLGQSVLDRGFGLGDQRQPGRAYCLHVFRHHVGDGIALRHLLQVVTEPATFRPIQNLCGGGFILAQRAIVEVGRVVQMMHLVVGVDLYIKHAFGDDAPLATAGQAAVLNRMFQIEKDAWDDASICGRCVRFIY